ncbi:hypothetical protein A0W34_12115 [Rhodococcus sp. BH4]|nr:hypothetical protein A0W34_12115 [Rhodococcus sp. BH4]
MAVDDAGDITLASYEAGANLYAARPYVMGEAMVRYLARIAKLVDGGTILELGSGPGRDAEYLESLGVWWRALTAHSPSWK